MTSPESAHTRPTYTRDDLLVSVSFGELPANAASFSAIADLSAELEAHFRFHEIIIVAESSSQEAYHPLIRCVSNLRLFTVRDGTPHYRRRVIAAEEAIGDVVLISSASELACIDVSAMIERAADEQRAVIATRSSQIANRSLGAFLAFLGRVAGFNVNLHDLQSLALPRTLLNQLLGHPDPDLAMRFPPRDPRMPLVLFETHASHNVPREAGLRRRLLLLQKLLVYMAPRLLMAVTVTSGLLTVFGISFGFYVLGVWIVKDSVAPGWVTLSGAISLTALFLGPSIMGLSLGLLQLLARTSRDSFDGVAAEINKVDLFGQVAKDLNIELEQSRPESLKPSIK